MTALITLFAPLLHAFSTGGGLGFIQLCDAVDFCSSGTCPRGMHLVAPPTRSSVYQLRTGDLQPVAQDPTSYVPGELVKVYVRVTSRMIPAKYEAGARTGPLGQAAPSLQSAWRGNSRCVRGSSWSQLTAKSGGARG